MSDWYLSQLARQDEYGGLVPPDERGLQPQTATIGPAEMRSYTPTLGERIKGGISDLFRSGGADPYNAGKLGDIATTGLSLLPPVGIPVAKSEMEHGVEARSPGGVVMGALGAIPGVKAGVLGDIAKPFYSAAGRAVDNAKLGKGTGEQWLGYLRNQPGVKPEELNYVFGNLPEGQLTKAQMQAHAAENAVTLGEVTKGIAPDAEAAGRALAESHGNVWGELSRADRERYIRTADGRRLTDYGGDPKYSQWQLPGGENYRETLLTLPTSKADTVKFSRLRDIEDKLQNPGDYDTHELNALRLEYKQLADETRNSNGGLGSFRSSHWDEPNVLAHVRTNDREIPGVGKSLHVEEIQSDWHQKGRTSGYRQELTPAEKQEHHELYSLPDRVRTPEQNARMEAFDDRVRPASVPDAPFKSTWADVALKRQIREASEKGYDAISWTPGEAQAARYDLSKQVDKISAYRLQKGGELELKDGKPQYRVEAFKNNGLAVDEYVTEDKLADLVGKELAEKIIRQENGAKSYSGLDLKVGGEGMKAFYDKMLVDKANAIGKKHGARVEQAEIDTKPERGPVPEGSHDFSRQAPVHVLRITPELRAAAMKGFPLFTAGGVIAGGTIGELARQDKYGRNE